MRLPLYEYVSWDGHNRLWQRCEHGPETYRNRKKRKKKEKDGEEKAEDEENEEKDDEVEGISL